MVTTFFFLNLHRFCLFSFFVVPLDLGLAAGQVDDDAFGKAAAKFSHSIRPANVRVMIRVRLGYERLQHVSFVHEQCGNAVIIRLSGIMPEAQASTSTAGAVWARLGHQSAANALAFLQMQSSSSASTTTPFDAMPAPLLPSSSTRTCFRRSPRRRPQSPSRRRRHPLWPCLRRRPPVIRARPRRLLLPRNSLRRPRSPSRGPLCIVPPLSRVTRPPWLRGVRRRESTTRVWLPRWACAASLPWSSCQTRRPVPPPTGY